MTVEDDADGLDAVLAAVQAFTNGLAGDESEAAVVTNLLVSWEETSYGEGGVTREVIYAIAGPMATPTGSLGLALHVLRTLEADLIGGGRMGTVDE